jgi:DNA (cytosine-5)-methyltransferase 1
MTALAEMVVTDDDIDNCGFRMFELHEIAATMAFHDDYVVLGNKRERMAQYGGAVTPPVAELLFSRVLEVIADVVDGDPTFKDMFCGAGGTSQGARRAGGKLVLGLNHWRRAIESHSANFPDADHDCADISALTTTQIRRYPDSDVLLASPECTNHSIAKGGLRRKPQAASLFDDGPAGDDEQDRSRATMWDVVRFAEQKQLKGKPYKAIIVENVVDAFKWGANDDGGLFAAWRMALTNLGYESEIVYLNSMFVPPTPQSRDRMYVVFWQKGIRRPNLEVDPVSWCPHCEAVVNGRQAWKKPTAPWGRYGAQYLYHCPDCNRPVLPGAYPAISALDLSIPMTRIGDREKPLAKSTRERIRRGLPKLQEPFVIRLLHGGVPRPLTLPIVSLTRRQDMAITVPTSGQTHERTPGNRTRIADLQPGATVCAATRSVDRALVTPHDTLVMANTENGVPRPAAKLAAQTLRTEGGLGVVRLRNNGQVTDAALEYAGAVTAGGKHHGLVMRNNRGGGEMLTPDDTEPFRVLTTRCHQSLVVPYGALARDGGLEPSATVMTHDRHALIVPPMGGVDPRDAALEPGPTQTTTTRAALVTKEVA